MKFADWSFSNPKTEHNLGLISQVGGFSRENPFCWKNAVDWIWVIVGYGGGGEYKNLEFLKHEWSEHELIWHTESSDICKNHVYFPKMNVIFNQSRNFQ